MAQFVTSQVQSSRIIGQPQNIVYSTQFSPQPVIFQQAPVQIVQNRFVEEQPVKKETKTALRLKQFLFLAPALFFLVLLVFSSVIYGLRFQYSNQTTPAAVDTLVNFGQSLTDAPILDIRILPRYVDNDKNKGETNCKQLKKPKATADEQYYDPDTNALEEEKLNKYKEVTFDQFQQIRAGCVCLKNRFGVQLSYLDKEQCDTETSNCRSVQYRPPSNLKIFLNTRFCVRRVADFQWKQKDVGCDKHLDKVTGKAMRQCGPNLCVADEEAPFNYDSTKISDSSKRFEANKCPISSFKVTKDKNGYTFNLATNKEDEIQHFVSGTFDATTQSSQNQNYQITQKRLKTDQPIINLVTSLSNPRCLAQNFQRPLRNSHKLFKLQQNRESGCWPYGSHVDYTQYSSEQQATYSDVFVGEVSQADYYDNNNVVYNAIRFYKDYVMDAQDQVNLYAELRPAIADETTNCRSRSNTFDEVSLRAKSFILVLELVENFNFSFVILSSVGLALSLALVLLRTKNFVNAHVEFYLHLFTFGVAVALFVYPILFWVKVNRYGSDSVQDSLFYNTQNQCYAYLGQVKASEYLYDLISVINNQIFGLTTFLFVFDVLFLLGVVAAVFLRNKEQLVVFDPIKSDKLYYE